MTDSVIECFMTAFAAGFAFALVYEALRIIRLLIPFKWVTFLCDIAFFIIAANVVVKLSVQLGNYVRWSIVFGFGAGIFSYISTVGRLMNIAENAAAKAIRNATEFVFEGIASVLSKSFGFIAHMFSFIFGTLHKISGKLLKKSPKHLKNKRKMVYNNKESENIVGGSESGHVIHARVKRSVRP